MSEKLIYRKPESGGGSGAWTYLTTLTLPNGQVDIPSNAEEIFIRFAHTQWGSAAASLYLLMDSIKRHIDSYGNTATIYIVPDDSLGWQATVNKSKIWFEGYRANGALQSDTNCRAYVYYR